MHDEDQRLEQRADHRVDRVADELGRVVDDRIVEARREVASQLAPSRLDLVRAAVERVRARPLEDTDGRRRSCCRDRRSSCSPARRARRGRCRARRGRRAVGVGAHHDVARTPRASVRRPSVCTAELKPPGDVAGGWLMAPARDLHVRGAHRGDPRRRPSGCARRPGRDRARRASNSRGRRSTCTSPTPSMRRQHVLHVERGVVGDVLLVAACRPARSCGRPSSGRARPCAL